MDPIFYVGLLVMGIASVVFIVVVGNIDPKGSDAHEMDVHR